MLSAKEVGMNELETMTTEQIYKRFGVKTATVRLWCKKRIIKWYKLPETRTILVNTQSFMKVLEDNVREVKPR